MLEKEQWVKIAKGAGIAGGAAALTYLIEATPDMDLGNWTPVVVAFLSVAINVIRKYASSQD